MKQAFKVAATVAAITLGLSLFTACDDDDDDDDGGTSGVTASYSGEGAELESVTATVEDGDVTSFAVVIDGKEVTTEASGL